MEERIKPMLRKRMQRKRERECAEILISDFPPAAAENTPVTDEKSMIDRLLQSMGAEEWDHYIKQTSGMLEAAQQEKLSLQLKNAEARMEALQRTINPHFLYNSLEVIRGIALREGNEDIASMTEAMSLLFRYSISRPDDFVSLREELENVRQYFTIQKYRYRDRLAMEIHVEDEEQTLQCKLLRLVIQPLVENAIAHGLERVTKGGRIDITVFRTDQKLVIRVSDNGVGIEPEQLQILQKRLAMGLDFVPQPGAKGKSHIALVNINQRIKLYHGNAYGLSISSVLQHGTIAELTFPIQYK